MSDNDNIYLRWGGIVLQGDLFTFKARGHHICWKVIWNHHVWALLLICNLGQVLQLLSDFSFLICRMDRPGVWDSNQVICVKDLTQCLARRSVKWLIVISCCYRYSWRFFLEVWARCHIVFLDRFSSPCGSGVSLCIVFIVTGKTYGISSCPVVTGN